LYSHKYDPHDKISKIDVGKCLGILPSIKSPMKLIAGTYLRK
jgi:hypothetical protein